MESPVLAVVPGDGIGPEVVAESIKVLRAAIGDCFTEVSYDLGAERWLRTGEVLPDSVLQELAATDGILLGAVGAAPGSAKIPSGLLERGLLLKLRFSFDHYVNLRPSVLYPATRTPLSDEVTAAGPIDFVVVREGTEGLYCGVGGTVRVDTEHEIATEVSVNTAHGVSRVITDAFQRAAARRGRLTLVHKHNVLTHAGSLWQRQLTAIGENFPTVHTDYLHVDAATIALVQDPQRFDVVVTDNLFGDILTDLAAAVTGGIGLAASANINPEGTYPSMFEPVHGSAPDIAGQQIADPTAAILSCAMLLDHWAMTGPADSIRSAVFADISERSGTRSTAAIGDAIAARV